MSEVWQSIFEFVKASPTVATAIVAVLGIVIPALVSLFTARRVTGTEITKLAVGVQQKVLEQLVGARISRYPELYWLISSFRKSTAKPRTLDHAAASRLLTAVNNWDSHNALFLVEKLPTFVSHSVMGLGR
jgi:hypothetical protein